MVSEVRTFLSQDSGARYILRKNNYSLTLHEITAKGEKLVADKAYSSSGIMRRGYDNNGKMYRHSVVGNLDDYGYRKFDIRDLRSTNPKTLETIEGFHLLGYTNRTGKMITNYLGSSHSRIISKVENWKDLGPLAKRYLSKALEFAKTVK